MNSFRFPTRRVQTGKYGLRARRRIRPGGRPVRIDPGGYHARMGARELLTAVALCAAMFGFAFAIGRDARSTASAPREAGPWAVPAVSAGAAIPARLSAAPPVRIHVPAPVHRATHAPARAGLVTAPAPVPAETPLATPAPSVTPAPAPVPAPSPAPTTPQPRTQPAAPSGGGGAGRSPEAGKSFETSG